MSRVDKMQDGRRKELLSELPHSMGDDDIPIPDKHYVKRENETPPPRILLPPSALMFIAHRFRAARTFRSLHSRMVARST